MIRFSICGAASYACGELLRLMVNHPETQVAHLADSFAAGRRIQDEHPALMGFYDQEILPLNDETIAQIVEDSDVVFTAVDAGTVCGIAEKVLAGGKKFIDFGADIRFRDAKVWEKWYHLDHPNYEMTKEAVYCIPEIQRDLAKGKSLISNPGCYPTATTLGLYPALKEGLVVENTIVVDAKSGYTGAGRRPAPNKLLAEASNSFCAYALGGSHRHTPEIEQNIAYLTGKDLMKPETWQFINFQPHLTPQIRGIEVTIYATLNKDVTNDELYELYQRYYKDEYFVRVFPANKPVQTKWTAGTNLCCMTPTYDARTKRLLVSSVIDNIGKGAAGQAIQNMNIIFGLVETEAEKLLNLGEDEVFVCSTGVIGQKLPVEKVLDGVRRIVPELSKDKGTDAAWAIMTTDTVRKEVAYEMELSGGTVRIGAMAKGSGMIHPNMATMLAYITTDAKVEASVLQGMLKKSTDKSFNMMTVDGDTSTNDSLFLLANGASGVAVETEEDKAAFAALLDDICMDMARRIASDGEGATHLMVVEAYGLPTEKDAKLVARSIAGSTLFKAALFGKDANWGRIMAAAGYSGADVDPTKADCILKSAAGEVVVMENGFGTDFSEELAKKVLTEHDVTVIVNFHSGDGEAKAFGCDLTYDYVKINGDYRS